MEFSIKSSGDITAVWELLRMTSGVWACALWCNRTGEVLLQLPMPVTSGSRVTAVEGTETYQCHCNVQRGSQVAILSIFLQEFLILIWFYFSFLVFRIIGFYDTDRRGIFTHLRALEKLEPSLKLPAPLSPRPPQHWHDTRKKDIKKGNRFQIWAQIREGRSSYG